MTRSSCALILALGLWGCGAPEAVDTNEESLSSGVPLFRFYNKKVFGDWWSPRYSQDHFYTANLQEAQAAQSTYGYTPEGVTGTCASWQEPGTSPLYRLYSYEANNHFYTTDPNERLNALNQYHYIDEGITCYVYTQQVPGSCPLHRFSTVNDFGNPVSGLAFDHFYTMSYNEGINTYSAEGHYKYDGIAAFMLPYNTTTCPR